MKKSVQELNSIFSVAEEMIRDNGEDCYFYSVNNDDFIIASFDGCGGSGSKKYENYSGKTGAYIASRAVCGGVEAWFNESNDKNCLPQYIQNSLGVCKEYADKAGRIMGSLGKDFPTTAAIITGNTEKKRKALEISCFWAGDSRCYLLDSEGLHQLTVDDLDGQDAMSNLTNDGVMTNVISASVPFEIHFKKVVIDHPCVLMTATDGCFGYLNSPMEFEHLIIESLQEAKNISHWRTLLNDRMHKVSGDDYTLCVAAFGYKNFDDMKSGYNKRAQYIKDMYINSSENINELWEVYKKDYSKYLITGAFSKKKVNKAVASGTYSGGTESLPVIPEKTEIFETAVESPDYEREITPLEIVVEETTVETVCETPECNFDICSKADEFEAVSDSVESGEKTDSNGKWFSTAGDL